MRVGQKDEEEEEEDKRRKKKTKKDNTSGYWSRKMDLDVYFGTGLIQ